MPSIAAMIGAAVAEIGGCFAVRAWLRLGKSAFWLVPGVFCLLLFAYLLTLIESPAAGRAYAACGGLSIAAFLGWLWIAEGVRPDRRDAIGAAICVAGAAVILFGPRAITT